MVSYFQEIAKIFSVNNYYSHEQILEKKKKR